LDKLLVTKNENSTIKDTIDAREEIFNFVNQGCQNSDKADLDSNGIDNVDETLTERPKNNYERVEEALKINEKLTKNKPIDTKKELENKVTNSFDKLVDEENYWFFNEKN